MKNKNNYGITLIALIITIIILLILAGVAINLVSGNDGIFNKAEAAAFKTKMSAISEEVQMYRMSLRFDDPRNNNAGKFHAGKVLKSINETDELGLEEEEILDIRAILNEVTEKEEEYVIVFEGELYYVSQSTIANNEKQVQWCKELGIKIWDYEGNADANAGIKNTNGNYELVNGVYLCTPKLTTGFSKDYTRYAKLDKDGNLVPGNWISKKPDDDWYDYTTQNWANIYVESNGRESYYVWIPRYVYKLDSSSQRSDVKFVDIDNSYIDAETGAKTSWADLQAQGYQLPEAFWWDNNFDGQDGDYEQIPGYWMSKYQLSELSEYTIDYKTAATMSTITIQNITLTTAAKYTYALNGEIIYESTSAKDYTITGLAKGNKAINVTALDENGEVIGSMTKVYEVADVNEPDVSSFDPDTTFYVYWDEDGNEHNEIPISMDPPAEWYDYTTANWANIVTRNDGMESYYVWIPRYQYKLDSVSKPEKSIVKFIKGTSSETDAGYQIPEAFWWDNDFDGQAEDNEQIPGYWMSKYQLSTEESTPRMDAQMSAGSNLIRINDITGTLLADATNVTFEYYLNGELKDTGNSATEHYVFEKLEPNKTYTVNIIARSSDAFVGAVTKKIKTIAPYAPDVSEFNPETTFYVYWKGEEEKRVSIKEDAPSEWYDYSNQKWANIVTTGKDANGNDTESYFVWIPRYEYKILSDRANLSTANRRIDVSFITTDITNANCTPGYQVPEAFWWDNNGNGSMDTGEQLEGYWISKYQLSNN